MSTGAARKCGDNPVAGVDMFGNEVFDRLLQFVGLLACSAECRMGAQ